MLTSKGQFSRIILYDQHSCMPMIKLEKNSDNVAHGKSTCGARQSKEVAQQPEVEQIQKQQLVSPTPLGLTGHEGT